MRFVIRNGRDGSMMAAGTVTEVAEQFSILRETVLQQISKGKLSVRRKAYEWIVFDPDLEEEIMAEEAMDLIKIRMEREYRKAEQTKGTPKEFTYRHTANILRGILIDLEDFKKDTKNASH